MGFDSLGFGVGDVDFSPPNESLLIDIVSDEGLKEVRRGGTTFTNHRAFPSSPRFERLTLYTAFMMSLPLYRGL